MRAKVKRRFLGAAVALTSVLAAGGASPQAGPSQCDSALPPLRTVRGILGRSVVVPDAGANGHG